MIMTLGCKDCCANSNVLTYLETYRRPSQTESVDKPAQRGSRKMQKFSVLHDNTECSVAYRPVDIRSGSSAVAVLIVMHPFLYRSYSAR